MKMRPPLPAEKVEALRYQYEAEKKWHRMLMGEIDAKKRLDLYRQAYSDISAIDRERLGMETAQGFSEGYTALLAPWLRGREVLEIGCGYGFAIKAFAPFVNRIVGTEIAPEIVAIAKTRLRHAGINNFDIILQPAQGLDSPDESWDVVFTDDVWEHLHPEDAAEAARRVFKVLRPGGRFILGTVNRHCGPFDISCYFKARGECADGLHLFEWEYGALAKQLTDSGFVGVKTFLLPPSKRLAHLGVLGIVSRLPVPVGYKVFLEKTSVGKSKLFAKLFGLQNVLVLATKPV